MSAIILMYIVVLTFCTIIDNIIMTKIYDWLLTGPVTSSTENVGMFCTGGERFFKPTLVYLCIWRGGKRFYKPTLVPCSRQTNTSFVRECHEVYRKWYQYQLITQHNYFFHRVINSLYSPLACLSWYVVSCDYIWRYEYNIQLIKAW
jgi:hypothetical protein